MDNKLLGQVGYLKLVKHNIHLHGYKSLIYCYGLGAPRFVEYVTASRFLAGERVKKILDVGCGHSLLPSLLADRGFKVVAVDINERSVAWQGNKSKQNLFGTVVADGLNLPFNDGSFSVVISISAIEHLENEGDMRMMKEIFRVLEDGGICILSTGLSPRGGQTRDPLFGIPAWPRYLLGTELLHRIMRKLGVDRGDGYFERFYSREDILTRLIEPSGCSLEEYVMYWDWIGDKVLFRILPNSFLSIVELFLAKVSYHTSRKPTNRGGIILKLRKGSDTNYLEQAKEKLEPF